MIKKLCVATALVFLLPFFPTHAQAADCDGNFATSGNILAGKVYKTVAELPNVTPDSAYQGAYLSIVKDGFTIQQLDRTARVITALHNNSSPGRPMPLNATFEPSQNGTTITLTFATPAGAFASEDGIKESFCELVRAASVPQQEIARSELAQLPGRTVDKERAVGRPDTGGGRVCLANACIGMTLEEAANLSLKPRSGKITANVNFVSTKDRVGNYGLDANGKLVSIRSIAVDRAWIKEFVQTIHTMCAVPPQINAEISASDGTPINLAFGLRKQNGKVEYVLLMITRMLPNNMSASERRKFENEVRSRYGRAFIENSDIGRNNLANNGQLQEPVVMLNPSYLELRGPSSPELASRLMEQAGCSNTVSLD